MSNAKADLLNKLKDVRDKVLASSPADTVMASHNWTLPAISKSDIASVVQSLENKARGIPADNITINDEKVIELISSRLGLIHSSTYAHMFNQQHGAQALPAFMATMQWADLMLSGICGWRSVSDSKQMPASIYKRLASLREQIDSISVEKDDLIAKAEVISDASATAEALPATLSQLRRATAIVEDAEGKVNEVISAAGSKLKKLEDLISEVAPKISEADSLISRSEEAYRSSTSQGLAAAFDKRASDLSSSVWFWIIGLLVALGTGSIIGANRLEALTMVMGQSNVSGAVISANIFLSILSLGAPLWFAWLSTKQIGHRFKLAEDYAFKASVAKAYEGYRREAVRIDEAFEARLFSTALTRVEEAPLRLIDDGSHGSPWHELVSSDAFRKALELVPEFRDKFIEVYKDGAEKIADVAKAVKRDVEDVAGEKGSGS